MSVQTVPKRPYKYDWFDPNNRPDYSHIITEDDKPVDNHISELEQRLLTEPLYTSWKSERDFLAFADVGLFYEPYTPPIVPDIMVSMDVVRIVSENRDAKEMKTYMAWEYGKVPDIVIEIVSNRKGGELTRKVDLYEKIGVSAYVVYDPFYKLSLNLITAFRRPWHDPAAPYEKSDDLMYPEIGLGLMFWEGTYQKHTDQWLRWCTSDGEMILSGNELSQVERGRANAQERLTNAMRERAETAEVQNERLKQMLIAAGIDPDSQL